MTDLSVVGVANARDEELELLVGRSWRHLGFISSHLETYLTARRSEKSCGKIEKFSDGMFCMSSGQVRFDYRGYEVIGKPAWSV